MKILFMIYIEKICCTVKIRVLYYEYCCFFSNKHDILLFIRFMIEQNSHFKVFDYLFILTFMKQIDICSNFVIIIKNIKQILFIEFRYQF